MFGSLGRDVLILKYPVIARLPPPIILTMRSSQKGTSEGQRVVMRSGRWGQNSALMRWKFYKIFATIESTYLLSNSYDLFADLKCLQMPAYLPKFVRGGALDNVRPPLYKFSMFLLCPG